MYIPDRNDCKHPPATPATDGAVNKDVQAWCSYCGAALIRNTWHFPQMGKSGKHCHPDRGSYPLPSKEQYVRAGYSAENYDKFMARELAPIPKDKL
jgi:hypothetical protein